jgi:hypothetical protein
MVPLVLGIMSGSLISGQTISRTGKYKLFPVTGVVLLTAALISLSYVVDADTSVWSLVPFMVMLGLGLGFNFQPVILAVQNAVSPSKIGVATSSVTSFRQLGGTLGTAAFLSVLFNNIPGDIKDAVRASISAHPDLAEQFQKVAARGSQLNDTSFIQRLPAELAEPFKVGFATSLDRVFLLAGGVVGLAFFVVIFLPQLPLRTASGIQSQRADEARVADADARDVGPVETPPAG